MSIFQKIKSFFVVGKEVKPQAVADAIIGAMPDPLFVVNLKGVILSTNPAHTRVYGREAEEVVGKNFAELVEALRSEDIERFMNLIGKLVETGHVEPIETVIYAKDGREIPTSVSYSLIKDAEGNPKNIIAILRDITELKRAEEERVKAVSAAAAAAAASSSAEKSKRELAEKMAATEKEKRALAEKMAAKEKEKRALAEKMTKDLREEIKEKTKKIREVERSREHFMADAAHELRTPLAVLQTNLDLLNQLSESKNPFSSKDVKNLIESSQNRAKHLATILEELFLLSKGKKLEELRETINLETISEETTEELQPLADVKNINCQVKILDQDLEVMGDETMLRKVTSNLVSNAIKYGRERGKVKITLRKEAGEAELEVADNGIGISKKDLPHIFERFYRVGRRRPREKGSVGLGLAICKWIVELHGGRIEAESKYGKGSKFKVLLPLKGTWESRMGLWDYKIRRISPR